MWDIKSDQIIGKDKLPAQTSESPAELNWAQVQTERTEFSKLTNLREKELQSVQKIHFLRKGIWYTEKA